MHKLLVLLLVAACRIGFDEVPVAGESESTIACDGGVCHCPPEASCAFQCSSEIACSVDCTDSQFCAVDCGPAELCVVECPEAGCEVTSCGPGCTVLCGGALVASRSGANASCP